MEKSSSDSKQSSFLLFALVDLLLFHRVFKWVNSTHSFFLKFWSLIKFHTLSSNNLWDHEEQNMDFKLLTNKNSVGDNDDDEKDEGSYLYKEDMEIVMERLGLFYNPNENEKLEEKKLSFNEVSGMFDEKEPSLEEIKEAFDVFDENKDGFIDAMELQRVLCVLGLKEGLKMENCKTIIRSFDENGDGRIDFHEFVKLMENSFC